MPFDPERHHRRSIRLRGYDYTQAGAYFVTIGTRQGELFFDDARLRQIAEECWLAIPDLNPGVELDEWVLMPNHLHGIIVLPGLHPTPVAPRDLANRFSAMSPLRASLGLVVRKYKGAVTARCRAIDHSEFAWHRNYYEHIVRNERELNAIRRYIRNNPAHWTLDRDNPANSGKLPPPRILDDYLRDAGL